METLRTLTDEFKVLMTYADSDDPDDQRVFQDTVEGLIAVIGVKMDGYCTVMDQIGGNVAMLDKEIKRLTHRKEVLENNIKRMKTALKDAMIEIGEKKITSDHYTITLCNNGGLTPMKVDGEVPDNYKRIVYETDTEKIRKDLESGKQLPFAHLEERGQHVRIK